MSLIIFTLIIIVENISIATIDNNCIVTYKYFIFNFQMKLWTNLERLLACKKQCLENAQKEQDMGTVHIEPGTETLVLQ